MLKKVTGDKFPAQTMFLELYEEEKIIFKIEAVTETRT